MVNNASNKSKSLADYAYRSIRNDIITGRLKASEKLRLEILCKRYEIGMSPLREALARLIGDALVVSESQRGFWVADLSLEELNDLFKVRLLIETEAMQMSIMNADDEWASNLTEAYERLTSIENEIDNDDSVLADWEDANKKFHQALISRCGSPWLIRMLNTLLQQSERYRRISLARHEPSRNIQDEHTAIYEAAIQRNVLKACRLAELHLGETMKIVKKAFEESEHNNSAS